MEKPLFPMLVWGVIGDCLSAWTPRSRRRRNDEFQFDWTRSLGVILFRDFNHRARSSPLFGHDRVSSKEVTSWMNMGWASASLILSRLLLA